MVRPVVGLVFYLSKEQHKSDQEQFGLKWAPCNHVPEQSEDLRTITLRK